MALKLAGKQAIVAEVANMFQQATSVAAAEYTGLTVSEVTELRNAARERRVVVRVVRNTLARRALVDTEYTCLEEALVGPLVLFFSMEESSSCAKVIRDFIKTNDKLKVKAIALDGALLAPNQLDAVASLPTLEEARAILVSTLRAPASHLLRTLQSPAQELLRVMEAVGEKDAA